MLWYKNVHIDSGMYYMSGFWGTWQVDHWDSFKGYLMDIWWDVRARLHRLCCFFWIFQSLIVVGILYISGLCRIVDRYVFIHFQLRSLHHRDVFWNSHKTIWEKITIWYWIYCHHMDHVIFVEVDSETQWDCVVVTWNTACSCYISGIPWSGRLIIGI